MQIFRTTLGFFFCKKIVLIGVLIAVSNSLTMASQKINTILNYFTNAFYSIGQTVASHINWTQKPNDHPTTQPPPFLNISGVSSEFNFFIYIYIMHTVPN